MQRTIKNAYEIGNFITGLGFDKHMEVFYFRQTVIQELHYLLSFARARNIKINLKID